MRLYDTQFIVGGSIIKSLRRKKQKINWQCCPLTFRKKCGNEPESKKVPTTTVTAGTFLCICIHKAQN